MAHPGLEQLLNTLYEPDVVSAVPGAIWLADLLEYTQPGRRIDVGALQGALEIGRETHQTSPWRQRGAWPQCGTTRPVQWQAAQRELVALEVELFSILRRRGDPVAHWPSQRDTFTSISGGAQEGAAQLVLRMQASALEVAEQIETCLVIADRLASSSDAIDALWEHGVAKFIIKAMKSFPESGPMQVAGARALSALVRGQSSVTKERAMWQGAGVDLVKAMEHHEDAFDVQFACVEAFVAFAETENPKDQDASDAGSVLGAVSRVMGTWTWRRRGWRQLGECERMEEGENSNGDPSEHEQEPREAAAALNERVRGALVALNVLALAMEAAAAPEQDCEALSSNMCYLVALLTGEPQRVDEAMLAGAGGAVLRAMQGYEQSATLQSRSCQALSQLAIRHHRETLLSLNAAASIVQAMRQHPRSADVQVHGARALESLAGKVSENFALQPFTDAVADAEARQSSARVVYAAGATGQVLLGAIEFHETNEDVVQAAAHACARFTCVDTIASALVRLGIVETLRGASEKLHGRAPEAHAALCLALWSLARHEAVATARVAPHLLATAIHAFPRSANVQRCASGALWALSSDSHVASSSLCDPETFEALFASVSSQPEDNLTMQRACTALLLLTPNAPLEYTSVERIKLVLQKAASSSKLSHKANQAAGQALSHLISNAASERRLRRSVFRLRKPSLLSGGGNASDSSLVA
ncbi:Protein aardvark [Hondaea fermentalgiana]|uniref:Protein aardvark n=1 Tax=Hondaea fermentalgiana TaxID=2315210 RepID=A0A2R5G3H4_9STRA|nr:Protein aardvark [Hondaea fermentalgiana]|eukprot:GBG25587.1 Protein aardvark [Hondaea fermentalgiana]